MYIFIMHLLFLMQDIVYVNDLRFPVEREQNNLALQFLGSSVKFIERDRSCSFRLKFSTERANAKRSPPLIICQVTNSTVC